MANANKTVFNARNRKWSLQYEYTFSTKMEAEEKKDELKKEGKYDVIRITPFKLGSRKDFHYKYAVRGYTK